MAKIIPLLLLLLLTSGAARARTTTVRLAWDPSPSAGIVAYKVFYGYAGMPLTNVVMVPSFTTTASVPCRTSTSYTFFAVAVGGNGALSGPSNYITYRTRKR